jgi:hypothetical protein
LAALGIELVFVRQVFLITWATLPAPFASVIFPDGGGSHIFAWDQPQTVILLAMPPSQLDHRCIPPCLAKSWESLTNFSPELSLNRDTSNLCLPSSWDYRHGQHSQFFTGHKSRTSVYLLCLTTLQLLFFLFKYGLREPLQVGAWPLLT